MLVTSCVDIKLPVEKENKVNKFQFMYSYICWPGYLYVLKSDRLKHPILNLPVADSYEDESGFVGLDLWARFSRGVRVQPVRLP